MPRPRDLRPRHSVVNQWDLLGPLGFDSPDPGRDATEMAEDPAAALSMARTLASAGVNAGGHEVIVVHVSAGNPFRRWPAESFVQMVSALAITDSRRRIVVTSGPSEAEAASRIGREARARVGPGLAANIVSEAVFGLAELRELLARAALFIGGDSGPLHVASTTAVPVVGLFGPTLSARSAPWRSPDLVTESIEETDVPCRPCDQRRCEPGDFRCLALIAPGTVGAAAERALARAKQQTRPVP
ncbi:MAG: glycosyltransferase family 9 protein [Acidobacteria bacterium]|nr:glycosyltransferase family 9 protein [Acidobacteriota bacterium]